MVKYVSILISFLFFLYSNGQEVKFYENDTIVTISALDNLPCYNIGCKGNSEKELLKYIKKAMKYPESAQHDSIEGVVYISYLVEIDGSTSEHKIIKGVRYDIDKEALRICKLIKYAEPAKQANKPVRVRMVLPFKFSIPRSTRVS